MPARILILDTVATNRIVLKVKMQAAQFYVQTCADLTSARSAIARLAPDLILMGMSDVTTADRDFCASLRAAPATSGIAIIAVGVADTSQARFAALDAGADDVMPRPVNDTLLLARIRSLLRMRSTRQEFFLREGTSRALGFDDGRSVFARPAHIALVSAAPAAHARVIATLSDTIHLPVATIDPGAALGRVGLTPVPDVLVVDATQVRPASNTVFSLVSDLRSREGTRLAAQLVLIPRHEPEVAAMFLDLGADDVVSHDCAADELALRILALVRRKQQQDQLRNTVRDGLHAAVTDPLTGLYNRRYVAPHLDRIAREAQTSGHEFAVMMIDIDHFKAINDTYGHAAGDQVLIQLARRLRENLRAIDLIARMGGEEFLIAMPRTSVQRARLAADRLRRLVNNRPFDVGAGCPPIDLSVSVGVAVSGTQSADAAPCDTLCTSADAALYAAKSAGRNQVAVSQSAA